MTTEPLTPEALDTIEARHRKVPARIKAGSTRGVAYAVTAADLEAIAASLRDIPALVLELRRLRTENEKQREAIREIEWARDQAREGAEELQAKLDAINDLLSGLDLSSKITAEGTAWGYSLREALALSSRAALTGEATT
jgi:hypothetical protein